MLHTISELPDELHEYIARINKRLGKCVHIMWVKQDFILQCVIHSDIESVITTCLKEKMREHIPQCLPFSIDRRNEVANNCQLRMAMNVHAYEITSSDFSELTWTITKETLDKLGLKLESNTEETLASINTQFIHFVVHTIIGEAPCKAYRVR